MIVCFDGESAADHMTSKERQMTSRSSYCRLSWPNSVLIFCLCLSLSLSLNLSAGSQLNKAPRAPSIDQFWSMCVVPTWVFPLPQCQCHTTMYCLSHWTKRVRVSWFTGSVTARQTMAMCPSLRLAIVTQQLLCLASAGQTRSVHLCYFSNKVI